MDALPIFQQKKYFLAINNECMHGKVNSTVVPKTFKILSVFPSQKTEKFGVLISFLSKIKNNSEIESYKASVSCSKLHSIQMAAMNY